MKNTFLLVMVLLPFCLIAADTDKIPVRWVDSVPSTPVGVTFGVPWPRGTFSKGDPVTLANISGQPMPTQNWVLATWPDGSIKWLALAAVVGPECASGLQVIRAPSPAPLTPVRVYHPGIEVFNRVETGAITVDVGDRGTAIMQEIRRSGRTRTGEVNLIVRRERIHNETGRELRETEEFTGLIKKCEIEQSGPVRAVIRLKGVHRLGSGGEEWLPFDLRLIFWAGLDRIDVKHTFIFDGDPSKDFISGLGLRAHVTLEDGPENHFVRVAGEGGTVYCEPVRMLPLQRGIVDERALQFEGRRVEPSPEGGLLPCWGNMQLWQNSPDYALLRKRTSVNQSWIDVSHAHRMPGVMALGTPYGSLALGIRNFWKSYPTALECSGAEGPLAWMTAWLWSPDSPPMDLRHYSDRDTRPTYEAVNPDVINYSSAYGIGRTSEMTIFALPSETTNSAFSAAAASVPVPPQPACTPEWLHHCGAFGDFWTPVDSSTHARAKIEAELSAALDFYKLEVDQRRWYGFWNNGDVMHYYDLVRNQWFYDLGGYAWDNSELQSDQWLWRSFLRTGRGDIFRLAEAMTRHVSEVDSYHIGRWAALGTRHNVMHWGCPCKEPRVSQAPPKRFFYYLTADERTGDLLNEVLTADCTPSTNVPSDGTIVSRVNSDWWSFLGAWLTAWERTGDPQWRDRIVTSIESVLKLPRGLLYNDQAHYDTVTSRFTYWPGAPALTPGGARLVMIFGGCELGMELSQLLNHKNFEKGLEEYARIYAMSEREFKKFAIENPDIANRISLRWPLARLVAWTAQRHNDPVIMRRAWQLLMAGDGFNIGSDINDRPFIVSSVHQPLGNGNIVTPGTWMSTNQCAQWGLNAIALLALGGDSLTDEIAAIKPPQNK